MSLTGLLLIVFQLFHLNVSAQDTLPDRPRLIVGIVIDQMRPDYLTRFAPTVGEKGFRRIQREGFVYTNAHHPHLPTYTGPGHAAIYSGATPALHGITGNNWYDNQRKQLVECVQDTTHISLGGDTAAIPASPHHLLTTTLGDELKLATNGRAKVIGVSIKDRGAILPVGFTADGAYWYDGRSGRLVSSSFYFDALPDWVTAFNERQLADQYLNQTWDLLYAAEKYTGSSPDSMSYEVPLPGEEFAAFPYNMAELRGSSTPFRFLPSTPYANTFLVDFAETAIQAEQMGQDSIPDLLSIGFSATDYIGHYNGANSLEIQDVYARLDQDLTRLLQFLDREVGQGNYLMFISADHGATDEVPLLQDRRIPSDFIDFDSLANDLQQYMADRYGDTSLIAYTGNDQVYLDEERLDSLGLDLEQVSRAAAGILERAPGIHRAYSREQIMYSQDPLAGRWRDSYYPDRSGHVFMITAPQWRMKNRVPTVHGSPYPYDSHVPLMWYGWRVQPGASGKMTTVTQVAPTISLLLGTKLPSGCFVEPLEDILAR